MLPLLYGGYYTATIIALEDFPIFWITVFRLGIALVFFLPFVKYLRFLTKKILFHNFCIGIVFFGGIIVQSLALKLTTASSIGFLAALFIIFTPLIKKLFYKDQIGWKFIFPIIISLVGYIVMYFPTSDSQNKFGIGEILGIAGAFFIALHMVFTEKSIGDNNPITFSIIQIIYTFLFTLPLPKVKKNLDNRGS